MAGESLLFLCLLLVLDGATFSFATTALLLKYSHEHEPWQIALAGGAASAVGSGLQLLVLRWMLEADRPWMRRFLPSREKLTATLSKYPHASFLALLVARATPLPDAPLKLVAAAVRYPIPLYMLALFLGALPYYYLLAVIGHRFAIPNWVLIGGVAAVLLGIGVERWLAHRREGG